MHGATQEKGKGLEQKRISLEIVKTREMRNSVVETSEGGGSHGCFDWRQNFLGAARNIRSECFVYTSAAGYRAVLGEIQKKPRGGSRGAMTRNLSGR
jgi:hypothetical protein